MHRTNRRPLKHTSKKGHLLEMCTMEIIMKVKCFTNAQNMKYQRWESIRPRLVLLNIFPKAAALVCVYRRITLTSLTYTEKRERSIQPMIRRIFWSYPIILTECVPLSV